MPTKVVSRLIRQKFFYRIEDAGAHIGLSRAQSYRAATETKQIPVEKHGRFLLVPKRKWDAEVKRLLRGPRPKPRRPAAAEVNA
ncbi:hypothetical protein [Bradyrhizobium sp. USDA 4502]